MRNRPLPVQLVLAIVVPAALGALAGWLLGVNEIAYIVVAVLAIGGGYFAGKEHLGAREGAVRGLVGGALFGGFILILHEALGKEPKAELPDPAIIVLAITTVLGAALGAMGGAARKRAEEQDEEEETGFDLKRIKRSELIGFVGAAILAVAIFLLDWYSTSCSSREAAEAAEAAGDDGDCNHFSQIVLATSGEPAYGSFSAWEVLSVTRFLLLAACIAPFVLAYIVARGHSLGWRTGEVTMIIGIVAFMLILLNGIILGKPGSQSKAGVDISLEIGYLVALIGAFLLAFGGFRRQAEDIQAKPPGV